MNIKTGSIISLSDGCEYLVLSKVKYEDKDYLYFINMNDNKKIKIGCEKHEDNFVKIELVTNENLIKKLIMLFDKKIQEIF